MYTKKTNRTKTVKLLPSCPQHYMAVSGQPHTLVTLLPGDKSPGYPLNRTLDGPELVWIFERQKNISLACTGILALDHPTHRTATTPTTVCSYHFIHIYTHTHTQFRNINIYKQLLQSVLNEILPRTLNRQSFIICDYLIFVPSTLQRHHYDCLLFSQIFPMYVRMGHVPYHGTDRPLPGTTSLHHL